MATAIYNRGEIRTAEYLATAAIVVDQVLVAGLIDTKKSSVVIARNAIADTATGIVATTGVFKFPKISAAVIKCGEAVTWDATNGGVEDNAATGAVGDILQFGRAMEDAGNGVTTILVDISEPGTYKGS